MRSRTARIALVVLALLVPLALAACGSSSTSSSSSSEDPAQVLKDISGTIHSGKVDVTVDGSVKGSQSADFSASLNGAFQSDQSDDTALPQLNLNAQANVSGSGTPSVSFQGGLVLTSTNAYVTYQDKTYEIPASIVDPIRQIYAQRLKLEQLVGANAQGGPCSLSKLGIDPTTWLDNLTNEGTTDVEGTSATHISGDIDFSAIVADAPKIAQCEQQHSSGSSASIQTPSQAQISQLTDAFKTAHVDIYSGESDNILRKVAVSLDIAPPTAAASGITGVTVNLAATFSDVNQSQTITAPSNAQQLPPALLQQLQQALSLAQASSGGGILGGSSSSGTTTPPSSAGSSAAQQKFQQCVLQAEASGNAAAANKCVSLLQ